MSSVVNHPVDFVGEWQKAKLALSRLKSVDCIDDFIDVLPVVWREIGYDSDQNYRFAVEGLSRYFENELSENVRAAFISSILPFCLERALALSDMIILDGRDCKIFKPGTDLVVERELLVSLLSHVFLSTFPILHDAGSGSRYLNFIDLFSAVPCLVACSQLDCVLQYFLEVIQSPLAGSVCFKKLVMSDKTQPTLERWLTCDKILSPVVINSAVVIDEKPQNFSKGASACIHPELLASLVLIERLQYDELIVADGLKGLSSYFQSPFQFSDQDSGSTARILPGIASPLKPPCCSNTLDSQSELLQQLNQTLAGLGEYGETESARSCRRAKEAPSRNLYPAPAFRNAVDSLSDLELQSVSSRVADFTDTLSRSLLALALKDVLSKVDDVEDSTLQENHEDERHDVSLQSGDGWFEPEEFKQRIKHFCDCHGNVLPVQMKSDEMSGANVEQKNVEDELQDDVTDAYEESRRDWLLEFRRRSSNLSDISSRRSSRDTRHSSEFSSEFEDFFQDNFERHFDRKVYKTIKEEKENSASPAISEFATKLASMVLSDSSKTAVTLTRGVQNFVQKPSTAAIHKPKPVRPSPYGINPFLTNANQTRSQPLKKTVVSRYAENVLYSIFSSLVASHDWDIEMLKSDRKFMAMVQFADRVVDDAWCEAFGLQKVSENHPLIVSCVNQMFDSWKSEVSGRSSPKGDSFAERLLCCFSAPDASSPFQQPPITVCDTKCISTSASGESREKDIDSNRGVADSLPDRTLMQYINDVSHGIVYKSINDLSKSTADSSSCSEASSTCDSQVSNVVSLIIGQTFKELGGEPLYESGYCSDTPDPPPPTPASPVVLVRSAEDGQRSSKSADDSRSKVSRKTATDEFSSQVLRKNVLEQIVNKLFEDTFSLALDELSCRGSQVETGVEICCEDTIQGTCSSLPTDAETSKYVPPGVSSSDDCTTALAEEVCVSSSAHSVVQSASSLLFTNGDHSSGLSADSGDKSTTPVETSKPFASSDALVISKNSCSMVESTTDDTPADSAETDKDAVIDNQTSTAAVVDADSCDNHFNTDSLAEHIIRNVLHSISCSFPIANSVTETVIREALQTAKRFKKPEQIPKHVAARISEDIVNSLFQHFPKDVVNGQKTELLNNVIETAVNDGIQAVTAYHLKRSEFQQAANALEELAVSQTLTCDVKPVVTGCWGCSSADVQLRFILTWLAVSYSGAPKLVYYTFGDHRLKELDTVANSIKAWQWRVCDLMQALMDYRERVDIQDVAPSSQSLLEFLSCRAKVSQCN